MVPLRMLSGYLTVTNYEKHREQIREYVESLDPEKRCELESIVTDLMIMIGNTNGSRTSVL